MHKTEPAHVAGFGGISTQINKAAKWVNAESTHRSSMAPQVASIRGHRAHRIAGRLHGMTVGAANFELRGKNQWDGKTS